MASFFVSMQIGCIVASHLCSITLKVYQYGLLLCKQERSANRRARSTQKYMQLPSRCKQPDWIRLFFQLRRGIKRSQKVL